MSVKKIERHILLINPWIYDFAAYDFWLKPLGLLSIAALLRQNGFRVHLIDCLDRHHPGMLSLFEDKKQRSSAIFKPPTEYMRGLYPQKLLPSCSGLVSKQYGSDMRPLISKDR